MTDRDYDLDEFNLFEDRNQDGKSREITSERLRSKVAALDAVFDTAVPPVRVYPIEETLFQIHANKPISEPFIFGLVGEISTVTVLDDEDVTEYRGEYLVLETFEDALLKIGLSERESHRTDLDLESVRFEIPDWQQPHKSDI